METGHFFDGQVHGADLGQGGNYGPDALREYGCEGAGAVAVIDGAERLRASICDRQERLGVRLAGGVEEFRKSWGSEFGHIAGDDEVPRGRGVMQRGEDAAERAFTGVEIRNDGIAEVGIELGRPDESSGMGGLGDGGGDPACKGRAVECEQGFIAAHTRAAAPRQNESGALHRKMITLRFPRPARSGACFGEEVREPGVPHFRS